MEKATVFVGNVPVGGNHPVTIQSMTNTKTDNIDQTVEQIRQLAAAGCDIVRATANTEASARAFRDIKPQINIPLVADIHFDFRLALLAMEHGADKIRINPGNMPKHGLEEIISCAKQYQVPIRIGVNSGSIEKDLLEQYGAGARAMIESLSRSIAFFEQRDFYDLVLSAKASNVGLTIEVNRMIAKQWDYPIHLGVTEAGFDQAAIIKSAIGIGSLLADGIGNTIRVSLTGDPVKEIPVAREILQSLGLKTGIDIISCPTCGRTDIDVESIARQVKQQVAHLDINLTVAIMGCIVNGPGEAREADIGIAGGKDQALLFRKGIIIGKFPQSEIVQRLLTEIKRLGDNA